MQKSTPWIAALGLSALGATAAHAQSMTLTSTDIKEGDTIAMSRCSGALAAPAATFRPN